MNYKLEKVEINDKDILFNLLQFALYDGSNYIVNELNSKGLFDYNWFDNYFLEKERYAYFVKDNNKILGFVMINTNMKIFNQGYSIAEFLILPNYRNHHLGKKVAFEIFNMFKDNLEIEPIQNSIQAYKFWKKVITEYTKNNYKIKDNIFYFNNK